MNYKFNIILIMLFSVTITLRAQTEDFGLWSSVGVEKQLNKWEFSSEAELRTKDNVQQVNRWSLKLQASYHLFKPLQLGGGYEFIYFNDSEYSDYQPRHRGYAFILGKYKLGNFTFSLRERVQVTQKDDTDRIKASGKINTYKINPEWIWRNRFQISYNIPKFPVTPSLSVESFYQLNNPDGNIFNKLRYTFSLNYDLTKRHQIELYGLLDNEINVTDPYKINVVGVGYTFRFK